MAKRPKPPGAVRQAKNVTKAMMRWQRAGRPTRSDAEVERIYTEICQPCYWFEPAKRGNRGRCLICGCRVNLRDFNKLRWATESCPDDPPRWVATVDDDGQPIDPEPPPRPRLTRRERRARRRKRRRFEARSQRAAEIRRRRQLSNGVWHTARASTEKPPTTTASGE